MAHWGWYWKVKKKHISKTLCSKLISIDSFKIVPPGKSSGFNVQPLDIKAELMNDCLKVTYRKQKYSPYTIAIDKQPCNYGGFRYYFNCPLCKQRMRILYFAQNSIFLCRKCLNLAYKSQQLRPSRRYDYMCDKMKAMIKKRGGDLCQKPPHMHSEKYQTLKSKQWDYEFKYHQALNAELRAWHGAKIEPYLDKFFDHVDEGQK